jgi:hypothetical protein
MRSTALFALSESKKGAIYTLLRVLNIAEMSIALETCSKCYPAFLFPGFPSEMHPKMDFSLGCVCVKETGFRISAIF